MNPEELRLTQQLKALYLSFVAEHYQGLADEAARQQWTAVPYLARLIEGETQRRQERQIVRRVAAARFPVLKTLDQFHWAWPKKVNQAQIQNLFRLAFLKDKTSVIFIGGVGLGKTHLATALGHAACLQGHPVLFTTAIEAINTLSAAQAQSRLKSELKKFLAPTLLVLDELGYLPIDKRGADLMFQVVAARYESGSIVITTNRAFRDWGKTFDVDNTLATAMIDRLMHHGEAILIQGDSYRLKDKPPE